MKPCRRHFSVAGEPKAVIWWVGDRMLDWCLPPDWAEYTLQEQAREMGMYLCRGVGGAYIEVSLYWHHGHKRVQVESYAEAIRSVGRWTGVRYQEYTTLSDAIASAREKIRLMHRWMNSDGTAQLPGVQVFGAAVPPRPVTEIQREIGRLEDQQLRLRLHSGHGSKAGIAGRVARREWVGQRLYKLRTELAAQL